MNQFNAHLDKAKARQRIIYILSGFGLLVVAALVVSGILISNGTKLVIAPEDAQEIAQISVSNGVSVGDTIYSFSSSPSLNITVKGFKPVLERIPATQVGKTYQVNMFELPARLRIKTNSQNPQTKWQIDGQNVAIGAELTVELKAGTHQISVDDPYFEILNFDLSVGRDEEVNKTVSLTPINGTVLIDSSPAGASVSVDGQPVGVTPVSSERQGGAYTVLVQSPNHEDVKDSIEIKRGAQEVTRNYNLQLKKAYITVLGTPKNGKLLIDGVHADLNKQIEVSAIKNHQIIYSKPGYFSSSQEISLKPGAQKDVSFNLKAELGDVVISSSPKAQVWINGKLRGTTPLEIRLSALSHKLTIKKDGYRSYNKTISVKSQSKQKISVTLLTERDARLAEAKDQYTNSTGGKLKLFHPHDQFMLGAARSEKGQRANEFLRPVQLNKAFYAGLYEVTNAEFKKFSAQKAKGPAQNPVTSISWSEATAYCNWLSERENLTPFYDIQGVNVVGFNPIADGYRLLSEAEWEWLARKAGKKKQTIFTWGDETIIPPQAANIADESAKGSVKFYVPNYTDKFATVAPVGSFQREKSGLFDMAGNVSEWVHDYYSIVPPSSKTVQVNPLGSAQGQAHVVKGANFRSGTLTDLRPAFREGMTKGRDDLGFRIARYLYGGDDG